MFKQKTEHTPYYMGKPLGTVKAYTDGTFKVFKKGRKWTLSHCESNLDVFRGYPTRKDAEAAAAALYALNDIDWSSSEPFQSRDQAARAMQARLPAN